jgi:hypothetical protein
MKLIRVSLAALLAFAVSATVPAFAQHDHDGDSRHERDKDNGKGKGRDHEDRGRHEGRDRRDDHDRREVRDHDRREVRDHDRDRHEWREHEEHERHEAFERHEGREWREAEWREHERDRHVRYVTFVEHHHHCIPEDRFYAHFGYEHRFVIVRPVIVAGHARFQYGGYWFVMGRPLPPGWRYDDPVYVDFIDDGYYVVSPVHPGVHISVDIM